MGGVSLLIPVYSNLSQEVSEVIGVTSAFLAAIQPPLQLYSLPVIKSKAEFVYKSALSRYMHNQMLVHAVFIQQLGKNPSQLILPYFCTQVCKQHDPFPVTEHLPHFIENSTSNHK